MLHKHLLGLGIVAILMATSAPNVKALPTKVETQPIAVEIAHGNLLEVARGAGSFKTFIKAVEVAGLHTALANEGPWTVFAPTDTAFAKLPKGQLESLMKRENRGKLRKILTFLILPAKILYKDLVASGNQVGTVRSSRLTFTQSGNQVKVNGVSIVNADIMASNGVIHPIDKVLMPK
jgi:uncharacterized surface protein with fasciclin (FAS1) repeats